MKQIALTICNLIILLQLNAQINYIEVEYSFKITTPEGVSSTFFKTLRDNGTESIFFSKDTIVDGAQNLIVRVDKKKDGGLFTNKTTNQLYHYAPILNKDFYILEDNITGQFRWTIHDSIQKIILGYECKYATCQFRGRDYQVYFCDKLPFNTGPWKLTGLPGTILEASSKDGMYKFQSYKIAININPVAIINPYSNGKIKFMNFIEHKQLLVKKLQDLQMKAQSEEKEADVQYSFKDNSIELLNQ